MEIITSSKLILKPFVEEHLLEFVAAVRESDETVGMWMPWCHKEFSEDEARLWFDLCQRNIQNKSAYDIGIFLTKDGRLAGGIAINQINHKDKVGNIGYWVRGACQNQGIASDAVELIQMFGFNVLGLMRLEIIVLEGNKASRKVADKSGAKLECVARNRLMHNGKSMAAAVYSLVP